MNVSKNTATAPVDVLAGLDRVINCEDIEVREIEAIRAAVAELIEREELLRRTVEAIKANATNSPQCDADRLQDIVTLADATLARVGGDL